MVTRDKKAWIPLFIAFFSNKMLLAIVDVHAETMEAGIYLDNIQENNSAL